MGHSFSKTEVSIVGLEVQVYGLHEIKDSRKPIVALVRSRLPQGSSESFLMITRSRLMEDWDQQIIRRVSQVVFWAIRLLCGVKMSGT
jgi:hypothetical protein